MYRLASVLIILIAVTFFYIKREYIVTQLVIPDIVEWEKPSKRTPPLYGDITVKQYFIPNFNGLFQVGFSLKYGEPMGAKIEVALREKATDRELFKELIDLKKFPTNKIRRFSFPPLWDSAGKSYYLNISAHNADPRVDLALLYDTWRFFHKSTQGKLYFGNEELPGELSMVTECRVKVKKSEFLSFWHNFLADRGFAIFYISLIFIGLVIPFSFLA